MSIIIPVNLFDDYFDAIYKFQYLKKHTCYNEIYEKVLIKSIVDILKKTLLDILEFNYHLFETYEMKTYTLSEIMISTHYEQFVQKSDFFIQSSNILKVYHYLLSKSNHLFYLLMGNSILNFSPNENCYEINMTTIYSQPNLLGLDWKMMCLIHDDNNDRIFSNKIIDEDAEDVLYKYKKTNSEMEMVEYLFSSSILPDDIYKLNLIENNDDEIKYFDFKQLLDDFFHSQCIQLNESEINIIYL
jgi:hypothetical protein